jgi:hypothetical protein
MRFLLSSRAGGSSGLELAVAMMLASGCAATDSFRYDADALTSDNAECNQTDSTVTCCLKQNPGQYERCGATPPAPSEPINVGPPALRSLDDKESEEDQEDREKRCAEYYARCIEKIGQQQGSLYGTSQCRDCFVYCARHGFWPERVNKKKCPGA